MTINIDRATLKRIYIRYLPSFIRLRAMLKRHYYVIGLYLILIGAFLVRVINLNYNTAFNDEAIYIVVGKLGIYESDWWSYGADLWMAGLPYIYPVLTALAYQTGGLVGSRLLNVIFGVVLIEETYRFTKHLNLFDKKTNEYAAIISAFVAAFSAVGMYNSRLATYDMASFLFMFIGINSFFRVRSFLNGKYYFLSAVFILFAFYTKIIIGVFFPILFVYSILILKRRTPAHRILAIKYMYLPLTIGFVLYSIFQLENLIVFVNTHTGGSHIADYGNILGLIRTVTISVVLICIPSVFMLLNLGKKKEVVSLILFASVIPVFHLSLKRYATLDKHLYLSIIFLSVLIGYGLYLIYQNNFGRIRTAVLISLIMLGFVYIVNSYRMLRDFEDSWGNTSEIEKLLAQIVRPDDKILIGSGSALTLAIYDNTFPPKNIVTFDWIDYQGQTDNIAYTQAVEDTYFDYIQLDNNLDGQELLQSEVRTSMKDNYKIIYKIGDYEVYQRNE